MAKLTKAQIKQAIDALMAEYPDAGCALDHGSTFQLLVSVVLSAQTTDVSVNKVTPALFAKAPDAFAMAQLSEEEIAGFIRTIGMYRTKSANVKKLSQILAEQYGGEVPGDYDELVKLPGVGRKTANVVLAEGFGQQRIAVDTHVFRLANRIGFTAEKDVFATEDALMKAIPEDHWTKMHHALIWHGRRVCHARKPACEGCCLDGICKKNGL
ncbi:MAG: endonuclease III [Firmicutes bacterium]|nr:endonuclease III [Bacillota bacterium]MBQ1476097.1 endonuclease III [Bacillota bacterium]MBQ2228011.1 endonuclease III [Bacillota bacterium]